MRTSFNAEDLKRLESIDEKKLYEVYSRLLETLDELKRTCIVGIMEEKQLLCELDALAETAAKEVAGRECCSTKPSDGNGITYDTEAFRKWLKDTREIQERHMIYTAR